MTLEIWGHVTPWGWIALTTWAVGCGLAGILIGRHIGLRHLDRQLDAARHIRRLSDAEKQIPVYPADHSPAPPSAPSYTQNIWWTLDPEAAHAAAKIGIVYSGPHARAPEVPPSQEDTPPRCTCSYQDGEYDQHSPICPAYTPPDW